MSHDKIRTAARKRRAETGERYAAARRAVVSEHEDDPESEARRPRPGCVLRMSGELRDWLADLRGSDPALAARVLQAVAALMTEGASLGAPLAVSTAAAWPWALAEALDRSYTESLERMAALRRRAADAATVVNDIHDEVAQLESAEADVEDLHRRALTGGRSQEAAQAAAKLAAARRQTAEVRRLLPGVVEARDRLREVSRQRQLGTDAFRVRKEVLKASYLAAHATLLADQVTATSGLADEAIAAAQARLADLTAQMERELDQEAWPEGLMELRPGEPGVTGVRILFAIEPVGTALLISVLDGPEAVRDHYHEAILLSADVLHRVRAGEAPEAAAHAYDDPRSFLQEFGFSPDG